MLFVPYIVIIKTTHYIPKFISHQFVLNFEILLNSFENVYLSIFVYVLNLMICGFHSEAFQFKLDGQVLGKIFFSDFQGLKDLNYSLIGEAINGSEHV